MTSIARRFVAGTLTALLISATAVALYSAQASRNVPTEFNEFTDGSGRSNYAITETLVRP